MRLLYLLLPVLSLSYCARPIPAFAPTERTVEAADTVQFTNTSERAQSYSWDFGNGQTSTDAEPSVRYFQSGDYTVTLTATNEMENPEHPPKPST